MEHSFAESTDFTCPQCGQAFCADIWLIIDCAECPALLKRIWEGTLHIISCPHCGHEAEVGAPLLLYRPKEEDPVIFCPPGGAPPKPEDRELIGDLLGLLRERLDTEWQDDLARNILAVSRGKLLAALIGQTQIERLKPLILTLIKLPSWLASRQFIEEHPELLSVEVDVILQQLTASACAAGNPDAQREFEKHRLLLRRCCDVGIVAAFAELTEQSGPPPDLLALIEQAQRVESQGDLDTAVTHWERVANHPALAGAPESFYLSAYYHVGGAYLRRQRTNGQTRDLDQALHYLQTALERASAKAPLRPFILKDLGVGLRARYAGTGQPTDLDEAIRVWEAALAAASLAEHIKPAPFLFDLATGLQDRYQRDGNLTDLERALDLYRDAASHTPADSPDRPLFVNGLGSALRMHFLATANFAELDEAIQAYREATTLIPTNTLLHLICLNNLANALRERYEHDGRLEGLEEAIAISRKLVDSVSDQSPYLPNFLNNFGVNLIVRYERFGRLTDLDEAITAYQKALDCLPKSSPQKIPPLANLGRALHERYKRNGQLADLNDSLQTHREALALFPPNAPERVAGLSNLAIVLHSRYAYSGELADLEEMLQAYQDALALLPATALERPKLLDQLGNGLVSRYELRGHIEDLETAIQHHREALTLIPKDSPLQAGFLNNLGLALHECYQRNGQIADLEAALTAKKDAINNTPTDSPDLANYLNSAAIAMHDYYKLTGHIEALEQAISYFQTALQTAAAHSTGDSPNRAMHLNNLANAIHTRYERTSQIDDLNECITTYQAALAITPVSSPNQMNYLNNLGLALNDRYRETGHVQDLESSLSALRDVLTQTPSDSPDLAPRYNNLLRSLHSWYAHTGNPKDLALLLQTYQDALAALDQTFLSAPTSYQAGQQAQWIKFYTVAAKAYLEANQPAQALTIAEGGKSRLLTAMLGHGDLAAPTTIPASLVRAEGTLVAELAAIDTAALADQGRLTSEAHHLLHISRRRELLDNLQSYWREMKTYGEEAVTYVNLRQGYSPTWEELSNLANALGSEVAILSLFITSKQTLFFILRAGWNAPQLATIDLNGEMAGDMLRRFSREVHQFDGTVRRGETWSQRLQPLLTACLPHLNGVRWLVIVPLSRGHLLPWGTLFTLHHPAATVTLPALGGLPSLLRLTPRPGRGALVIGNPLGDLSAAEAEAHAVAVRFQATPLIGPAATKAAVMERLSTVELAHFSTHAYFASGSPLDSGIVLADGVLTARDILTSGLRAPAFIALSACQTGMVGSIGGDEMAGLSQALLYVGARTLLVSLWSVNDPATAHLMAEFYQGWQQHGQDKATALRKAMDSTRQAHREWSHTHYWGAFTLVGDWR